MYNEYFKKTLVRSKHSMFIFNFKNFAFGKLYIDNHEVIRQTYASMIHNLN